MMLTFKIDFLATKIQIIALLSVILMALAGCNQERYGTANTNLGDSVRKNQAIHTIDTWPKYAKDTNFKSDGKRALRTAEEFSKSRTQQDSETNTDANQTSGNGNQKVDSTSDNKYQ